MKLDYIYDQYFKGIINNISIQIKQTEIKDAVLNLDGYKHSMVQIISLAIALKSSIIISNPPLVSDTYVFIAIINELGGEARLEDSMLYIDARNICNDNIPLYLGRLIHGSMYLCPALLVALGHFNYYGSGGCQIGDNEYSNQRPIEHILSMMSMFGAELSYTANCISGRATSMTSIEEVDIMTFSNDNSTLSGPLVGGATKVALILSIHKSRFLIKNAYLKTDVMDMIRFLRFIGKKVLIKDSDIYVEGQVSSNIVYESKFCLTQCISELITYSALSLASGKKICFNNLNKKTIEVSLKPEFSYMEKMGISVIWDNNNLHISALNPIKSIDIEVLPSTIQSDHHPFFALLLLFANDQSILTEYVWKDRFKYIDNLKKMGASITAVDNQIFIKPSNLLPFDGPLPALDVRSAAVTLLAGILSCSNLKIYDAHHIFRGYSRLVENMQHLGVELLISSSAND